MSLRSNKINYTTMFNSFGNIFRLSSFGESHGPGVGGVIDGFPAGITIDMDFVQQELNRRRPGQSLLTTSRQEPDKVEFLSGIFEGKSTGCPIGFIVWNPPSAWTSGEFLSFFFLQKGDTQSFSFSVYT